MIESTDQSGSAGGKQVLNYATPASQASRIPWLPILVGSLIFVILVFLLLPPLGKTPSRPNQVNCGINEHQIFTALYDYSARNGGSMPQSLAQLKQSMS